MGGSPVEDPLSDQPHPAGLKLIETLLWDGVTFPRLPLHLSRLTSSAARLGWPAPAPGPALSGLPATPLRVRLTLDAAGQIAVTTAPLPPARPLWRVALHPQRLASSDPWLTVKSTQRALYDTARAALPEGVDEWLFANERDELCEGTITNIFFDRGRGLRTPPLASGLLPGVLRAELALPEEVLALSELPRTRLWVGNALRGLIPALVASPSTASGNPASDVSTIW
jgi:4-amino-4-deoxychorismate lyase